MLGKQAFTWRTLSPQPNLSHNILKIQKQKLKFSNIYKRKGKGEKRNKKAIATQE